MFYSNGNYRCDNCGQVFAQYTGLANATFTDYEGNVCTGDFCCNGCRMNYQQLYNNQQMQDSIVGYCDNCNTPIYTQNYTVYNGLEDQYMFCCAQCAEEYRYSHDIPDYVIPH